MNFLILSLCLLHFAVALGALQPDAAVMNAIDEMEPRELKEVVKQAFRESGGSA